MALHGTSRRIVLDRSGAAMVEFALLAPLIIAAIFGVLQIGMAMQSYNAIRNVTADTARYALVEYQKGQEPSNAAIRTQALSIADGSPYLLKDENLTVTIENAATQRITGVKEMVVTISYAIPTILPVPSYIAPTVSHSQAIFVLA